jgi:hypothetical protein
MILLSLLYFGNGRAISPIPRCAIIIVSDLDGFDDTELEKADQFYQYLKDEDHTDDDIYFLTEEDRSGYDGNPNVENFEKAFSWLKNTSGPSSQPVIYVYDHVIWGYGNVTFQLSDGNITTNTINEWLSSTLFQDITMILGGKRSGMAGPDLSTCSRDIICSMGSDQIFSPDQFNITRSLEDPSADTNQDCKITYVEAYWKEVDNLQGTGQDPFHY